MNSRTETDRDGIQYPARLDGLDLSQADECPSCGDTEHGHVENPAGYYTCQGCWTTWAGDYTDADVVSYFPPEGADS